MSSDCTAVGALARLAVQDGSEPRTFSVTSEAYAFISEDIRPRSVFSGQERGVGEIGRNAQARRRLITVISGDIELPASPNNIAKWTQRTLWGPEMSHYISPGTSSAESEFDLLINRENGTFRYHGCVVNSALLKSEPSEGLATLVLNIVAKTMSQSTAWPTPQPEPGNDTLDYPYTHFELTTTVNGQEILIDRSNLLIENHLIPVASASQYAQKFRSNGRSVTYTASGAFNADSQATLDAILDENADGTVSYVSSELSSSTIFQLQNFQNTGHTHPTVSRKNWYTPITFQLTAGKSNALTPEITVTHT